MKTIIITIGLLILSFSALAQIEGTSLPSIPSTDTSIYAADGSLAGNRALTQNNFDLNFDANTLVIDGSDDRVGIGTDTPAGTLEVRSGDDQNAFYFVQENGTTGEKDVFTIEDQDVGGGGQDESSVLKVLKSADINASDNGFSLIELASTGADPGANKYWISGRTTDEDAPLWGVDITDNDFWSEGGIQLGVTGANGGIYSGGTFTVTNTGQITSSDLAGTGTRMIVADASGVLSAQAVTANTDNQTASEVNSDSPVDVDGDGNTEATVEDVIQDIAPITSASGRIFYPPSIEIDASTNGAGRTVNLYQEYVGQFGSGNSDLVKSIDGTTTAPDIPIYAANELYYYVTYFDPLVFSNISIDGATGIMTYSVIGQPTDYNSLINVVFVVK